MGVCLVILDGCYKAGGGMSLHISNVCVCVCVSVLISTKWLAGTRTHEDLYYVRQIEKKTSASRHTTPNQFVRELDTDRHPRRCTYLMMLSMVLNDYMDKMVLFLFWYLL